MCYYEHLCFDRPLRTSPVNQFCCAQRIIQWFGPSPPARSLLIRSIRELNGTEKWTDLFSKWFSSVRSPKRFGLLNESLANDTTLFLNTFPKCHAFDSTWFAGSRVVVCASSPLRHIGVMVRDSCRLAPELRLVRLLGWAVRLVWLLTERSSGRLQERPMRFWRGNKMSIVAPVVWRVQSKTHTFMDVSGSCQNTIHSHVCHVVDTFKTKVTNNVTAVKLSPDRGGEKISYTFFSAVFCWIGEIYDDHLMTWQDGDIHFHFTMYLTLLS